MFRLPLEKSAGIISTVSNAISHPIGQATLAAAPIAAASIPLVAQHMAEKKEEQKAATLGLAPTSAGGFKAPLPPVQARTSQPTGLFNMFSRKPAPQVTPSHKFSPEIDHNYRGDPMGDMIGEVQNTPVGMGGGLHSTRANQLYDANKSDLRGLHEDEARAFFKLTDRPKMAFAPLVAGAASMLARPGVQAAMNVAPLAMALAPSRAPTPSPSPAQPQKSPNQAQPSTAFSTTTKQSAVATTPEGVIDNRQTMTPPQPVAGPTGNATVGKPADGISPGVSSTSKSKSSKPKTTTSPGAPKAFKMAWYLPFQGVANTIKDFGVGMVNAADQEAGKMLSPTDTLDPVKTRTPTLSNII